MDLLQGNTLDFPVLNRTTQKMIDLLRVFARQDETILISGPSGVGKSRLAAFCHAQSKRREGPFQMVDLLSVPEEMQMAELFGWTRGAFTGAVAQQEGCVAKAEGGTLFIDEIDKLSLRAQAGLLQLLETRSYRVLGDAGTQRVANLRFVVATNADLPAEIARGRFREDLYFRINVLRLRIPPLDRRRDEVVGWAELMLDRRHKDAETPASAFFSDEAKQALISAQWPGNLRQLDNVVRRAYALALADQELPGRDVVIGLGDIQRALALDEEDTEPQLLEDLRWAADRFIEHAIRRRDEGAPLEIDHASAFRGLVLEAGLRRLGGLDETYRLLGGESLVRGRNHHRAFRRESREVERLAARLESRAMSE